MNTNRFDYPMTPSLTPLRSLAPRPKEAIRTCFPPSHPVAQFHPPDAANPARSS